MINQEVYKDYKLEDNNPLPPPPLDVLVASGMDSSTSADPKKPDLLEPKDDAIRSPGANATANINPRLAELPSGANNFNKNRPPHPMANPPYLRTTAPHVNYASVDSDSGRSSSSRGSSTRHVTFKPGEAVTPPGCGGPGPTSFYDKDLIPEGRYIPYDAQKHGIPEYDELLHDDSIPTSNV